ncbi:MAG: hypothetical protein LBP62_00630 [Clostridiales bacterium]|jgi:hypothetical protein|nr:hypothetical protein [Clostridiales bacterium]
MRKLFGFILGFALSLVGVVVWVLLEAFLGLIASATAYLIALLFFAGYKLVVRETELKGAVLLAGLVVFFDIVLINLLYLLSDSVAAGMPIPALLAEPEYLYGTILYIVLDFTFGAMGIFGFFSKAKRDGIAAQKRAELRTELVAKNGGNPNIASVPQAGLSSAQLAAREEFYNRKK